MSAVGCLEAERATGLYSSYVMPPDYVVPNLDDDPAAVKKLDANDGFGTAIPLRTGYFGGGEVEYWDLGTLTATTLRPMFVFRRLADSSSGLSQDASHPDLIDGIPGDTAYSPLRQVFIVYVTDNYRGERITSLRALDDAVELGLVLAPRPFPYFVNCVVTTATVQMQVADDGTMISPQSAYYRGKVVKQFCIGGFVSNVGAIQLDNNTYTFTPRNAYLVRRANDALALDEALLKQDLNSDGDQIDTNTIFDADVGTSEYAGGVWRSFDVVVPRDYQLGAAEAEADLFQRDGNVLTGGERVIEYKDNAVFLNRPIRFIP
ncbi:MAG: hypothetical protein ABW321_02930 [Polyangiales bacterium]